MSPHVLTCLELRHTHNVILFSFAIFHACSTYMFNECTGDSAHGPLWSPLIGFQQEKVELVYAHAQRKMDDWRSAQWHVFGCLVDGLFGGGYYYICMIYSYYYYYYYYYYWMILLVIIPDINQILLRKPCIIWFFSGIMTNSKYRGNRRMPIDQTERWDRLGCWAAPRLSTYALSISKDPIKRCGYDDFGTLFDLFWPCNFFKAALRS